MIVYNTSFLTAALILLLLILFHFVHHRKLEEVRIRIFRAFLILGISDVLAELAATYLMYQENPELNGVSTFVMTVFYLLQVMVPYSMLVYTCFLCGQHVSRILTIPAVLMALLVGCNVGSGILFRFDSHGIYVPGTLYLGMYLYAIVYAIIVLLYSIFWYQNLKFSNFCTICEYLVIMAATTIIQSLDSELLMTGFGLSLGIALMYITINNPSGYEDHLTGIFDLQSFMGYIRELCAKKRSFHVIMVDLCQLKQINMLYGMSFGDAFLEKMAEELEKILKSDYAFRISSRRFVMITYSLQEYERVCNQVQDLYKGTIVVNGEKIALAAIICGVANAETLEDSSLLLAYMEYLDSSVTDFSETILVQSDENTMKGFHYKKDVEHYLHTAIDRDLFEVYYQPIFSVETQDFVALEALSRLRHPVWGYIPPDDFIGIAEHNGQIAQIGQLQFRKVCQFVKENSQLMEKIHHIKFNLSPAELLRDGYIRQLLDTIEEYSLPYSYFQFEITETLAMEYSEELYQIIDELMGYGISLSLDDFGSGYANMDAVLKLPFSSIKIDRSLLNGITEDEKAFLFYQNIVAALKSMGYIIISEGAEHQEEVDILLDWDVNMIQGYYFSRPLNQEDLLDLLCLQVA